MDNREVVTIRGVTSGEYTVNIHMYRKNSENPTDVTVEITKINPFSTILLETITLDHQGQEETVCRFSLSPDGDVISITDLPKPLVSSAKQRTFY